MAANEYVKAAASQLENAATAVKAEADQLRSDLATKERQMIADIDVKDQNVRLRSLEIDNANNDGQASAMYMVVKKMERDMQEEKRELDKLRSDIQAKIKQKESQMQALKSQAQGLQNQAASLK